MREEKDLFYDASALDRPDLYQKNDVDQKVSVMLKKADKNGVSHEKKEKLHRLVTQNINIFRSSFSSGSPTKVEPLRIMLTDEAKPFRVCIRNYSLQRREFLSRFSSQR